MKSYHEETLAALFDGEVADPEALADALAQPEARDFLVELSRLRALTQDDDRRPDERFYAEMKQVLRPRAWRVFLRLPIPLPAAAAAVTAAVAMTLAWFALVPGAPPPLAPPPPAIADAGAQPRLAPAEAEADVVPQPVVASTRRRPPKANRVLHFVDGGDWRQGS